MGGGGGAEGGSKGGMIIEVRRKVAVFREFIPRVLTKISVKSPSGKFLLLLKWAKRKSTKIMSFMAWTEYKAEEDTELSLIEGDVVTIIDSSDDDW